MVHAVQVGKALKQLETTTEATDVESPKDEQTPLQRFVQPSLPLDSIICGDNCDVLGTFPRECIDLVVTSPPYDDLRTYGGHDWDFYGVAWQLCRVLKQGGVIVWNVNDQTIDGDETGTSWAQANHFRTLGLKLWDTMIWQKTSSPGDGKLRYHNVFEYMFVLTKERPATTNIIRDQEPSATGSVRGRRTDRRVNGDRMTERAEPWVQPEKRFRDNIWRMHVGSGQAAKEQNGKLDHPAYFPEALARDHIRSWSNEGDIVLDPFNGSGTTTKMARELGRQWIGIDVNDEYCEIARKRLEQQLLPFDAVSVSG